MYIIDGNNLLHTIYKVAGDTESINDVGLCRAISRMLGLTGEKGEIVFDGSGPPDKSGFDHIANLEISFSGLRSEADTVIEGKIKASTAPRNLTIVSSDRQIRKAARARKAMSVKSENFWIDLQKQLNRKATVKEPTEKRQGISDSETEQWLDLFGLEQ